MKGEELMEAMGGLDEALLKKADSYKAEKRSGFGWTRYLGIAACIMLLVGLAVINMSLANVNSAPGRRRQNRTAAAGRRCI